MYGLVITSKLVPRAVSFASDSLYTYENMSGDTIMNFKEQETV